MNASELSPDRILAADEQRLLKQRASYEAQDPLPVLVREGRDAVERQIAIVHQMRTLFVELREQSRTSHASRSTT